MMCPKAISINVAALKMSNVTEAGMSSPYAPNASVRHSSESRIGHYTVVRESAMATFYTNRLAISRAHKLRRMLCFLQQRYAQQRTLPAPTAAFEQRACAPGCRSTVRNPANVWTRDRP